VPQSVQRAFREAVQQSSQPGSIGWFEPDPLRVESAL
jgi:hypothetical protein